MIDEINLNGWGDYRPVKKPETKNENYEFQDVLEAFNRKYGKGTLIQPGMVDSY